MSHPTRTMRAINPAPDEQETAPTRQIRGINPAPDESIPVVVHGQEVGRVTPEADGWYARSIKGKSLGPFVHADVASRALEAVSGGHPTTDTTNKKLKSRLLR